MESFKLFRNFIWYNTMVNDIISMNDNRNHFFTGNLQTQKSINGNREVQKVEQKMKQVFINLKYYHYNFFFFSLFHIIHSTFFNISPRSHNNKEKMVEKSLENTLLIIYALYPTHLYFLYYLQGQGKKVLET